MISIQDKDKCCGCAACVQVCPKQCFSFEEDEEGFRYPVADRIKCIDCGLCEKVCPVINQYEATNPIKVYAAINKDEVIRMQSSSGGIFTLLAEKVIREGGVVFGAAFDENWEVQHTYVETIKDLAKLRTSKYVQSRIEDNFIKAKDFLKQGRKVMFTGTSCQIAGLKHFLRKDYENLLAVDVICHGVPSPMVWRDYLQEITKAPLGASAGKNTVSFSLKAMPAIGGINFREKRPYGWKKYGFSVTPAEATAEGGNSVFRSLKNSEDPYMRLFLHDVALRPSCYACPAKGGKSGADITLADYWGIEKQHPEMDDDKGTCLLIVQTEKGLQALDFEKMRTLEVTLSEGTQINPSYLHSKNKPAIRDSFFDLYKHRAGTIDEFANKLLYVPAYKITARKYKAKLKRIVKKLLNK